MESTIRGTIDKEYQLMILRDYRRNFVGVRIWDEDGRRFFHHHVSAVREPGALSFTVSVEPREDLVAAQRRGVSGDQVAWDEVVATTWPALLKGWSLSLDAFLLSSYRGVYAGDWKDLHLPIEQLYAPVGPWQPRTDSHVVGASRRVRVPSRHQPPLVSVLEHVLSNLRAEGIFSYEDARTRQRPLVQGYLGRGDLPSRPKLQMSHPSSRT